MSDLTTDRTPYYVPCPGCGHEERIQPPATGDLMPGYLTLTLPCGCLETVWALVPPGWVADPDNTTEIRALILALPDPPTADVPTPPEVEDTSVEIQDHE